MAGYCSRYFFLLDFFLVEPDDFAFEPVDFAFEPARVAGFFFAATRLVVVEPPELDVLFAGAMTGRGAGVAAGAVAAAAAAGAARVRPPATATSGSKPSSLSAIRAPAVMAI